MISAVVIALNESHRMADLITNIAPYVSEIVVLDGGSTDDTRETARALGATVHYRPFDYHFGNQRNWAKIKANNDWILAMDCDELLEPAIGDRLSELVVMGKESGTDCFQISEKNVFTDRDGVCECHQPVQSAPDGNAYWNFPDYHRRLFRAHCYWEGYIHETIVGFQKELFIKPEWGSIVHLKDHKDQGQSDDLYYIMRPTDYPERLKDDPEMQERLRKTPSDKWLQYVREVNPSNVKKD